MSKNIAGVLNLSIHQKMAKYGHIVVEQPLSLKKGCYWSDNFETIFGILRFFQKTNEWIRFFGLTVLKTNLFVPFWKNPRVPKSPFEIIWPLECRKITTTIENPSAVL